MDAGDEGEPQADGVPRGGSEGGEERANPRAILVMLLLLTCA